MASPRGFEPPTPALGGPCSSPAELRGHNTILTQLVKIVHIFYII